MSFGYFSTSKTSTCPVTSLSIHQYDNDYNTPHPALEIVVNGDNTHSVRLKDSNAY